MSQQTSRWKLGQRNQHTGVAETGGIPYAYEHADSDPETAEFYLVTTRIDYTDRSTHQNRHFVPWSYLNEFLEEVSTTGEQIVDVRPLTPDQADAICAWYRGDRDDKPNLIAESG